MEQIDEVHSTKEEDSGSIRDFFKNRTYVINMLIMVFDWTFILFSMYLLSFLVKYIPGDKYFNLMMMAIADVLPSVLSSTFMICISRKNAMIYMPAFMVICVPIYYAVNHWSLLAMSMILIIRFTMTLHYTFVNYAMYEFFPPTYLTFVFGVANIVSGLFCILSPMAVEILEDPFFLVVGAGILATIISCFLKPVDVHK